MQHQVNPHIRTELVEILINNIGVQEFILGQLPNLRTAKRIIQVEALQVAQVTLTPSGRANVNATVFNKSFLRLINSENVEYRQIALPSLAKTTNGTEIPLLNTPQIDPEKSKIFVANTTGLVNTESFLLQVTYEK